MDSTVTEAPEGQIVELSAVGAAPDQYLGSEVQVADVPVASVLGARGFWADVPGANPFLVIAGPAVADVSWITVGATPTLAGTVEAVTPEELDGWIQQQVLVPDARAQAAFATHYLLVSEVVP
jgi:hypothetical protein